MFFLKHCFLVHIPCTLSLHFPLSCMLWLICNANHCYISIAQFTGHYSIRPLCVKKKNCYITLSFISLAQLVWSHLCGYLYKIICCLKNHLTHWSIAPLQLLPLKKLLQQLKLYPQKDLCIFYMLLCFWLLIVQDVAYITGSASHFVCNNQQWLASALAKKQQKAKNTFV